MSFVSDPVAPPAHAYTIMERILSQKHFVNTTPPEPPTQTSAGKGPGYRVQITSRVDQKYTQWDLWPVQWSAVKAALIGNQDVTVRVLNAW